MTRLYRPLWPVLLVLVAGVAVLFGLSYLPSRPSGEELPAQGGSYVEGVAGSPSNVNPLVAGFNDVDRDLSSPVFAGLVRLGPTGAVQPDLAGVPKVTPDGLSYIFELQPGLVWQDGAPLTSSDVVFTIETIQDPSFDGNPVLSDLFQDVHVEARDTRTVVMTLQQPFAPFLARGATVGILPEHILRGQDAAAILASSFGRQPVGSGPFVLEQLTSSGAVLRPFEGYHLGRPLLDRIELRFFRDDAALLNAIRSREIDGALLHPGLDPEDVSSIDGDSHWVRRSLHTTTYSLVYLNGTAPPFGRGRVRLALQHAIDVPALIENVLAGQALPIDSPIIRDLWAYVGSPNAYAHDLSRAGALLDAEGWTEADGGREKDGEPLAFSLAASDDPLQLGVAQELARQWSELGIKVDVRVSGASQFVQDVLLQRAFDAALVTVDPGPDPDPYPLWHSTQTIGEGRNLAGFSDPQVDELLENGRLTTSTAQRAEDYRAFQEIFAEKLPALLLYTPTYQYVIRSDLQGLSPGLLLTPSSRLSDISLWSLERKVGN